MIQDPEVMPRIPTADADGKFVATPMALGLRFAGTVELAGLAAEPDWRRARILLEQGRRMLPGSRRNTRTSGSRCGWGTARRARLVTGARAVPRDAGRDLCLRPRAFGMTSAPMTGRVVADLVAGRPTAIDIAPFSPERF